VYASQRAIAARHALDTAAPVVLLEFEREFDRGGEPSHVERIGSQRIAGSSGGLNGPMIREACTGCGCDQCPCPDCAKK
jgi:hypothetical protein